MFVPDDLNLTPEDAAIIDALPLGSMEAPSRSYVAVANRLKCSPEEAANKVKDLENRGIIELTSDHDGDLSEASMLSSWTWRIPSRWN